MQQILVINDFTPAAIHAGRTALTMAKSLQFNLVIATVTSTHAVKKSNYQLVTTNTKSNWADKEDEDNWQQLEEENLEGATFTPKISHLDFSRYREKELAAYINQAGVSLVVRGTSADVKDRQLIPDFNTQSVVNQIRCPLLLVPQSAVANAFNRLCYLTDLRYCRLAIVKFLTEIGYKLKADILVNHVSFKGMTDLSEPYGQDMFEKNIHSLVRYPNVHFNNIREKDVAHATDVIINNMGTNLLVLVHHEYHFRALIGRYITKALPASITVPLLIFPF